MALTAAEQVAVRRYAGYGVAGAAPDALDTAMLALNPDQETVVRTTFLPSLAVLELGLTGAADTLDTAKAAVWERNPAELAERSVLYRGQRLALCRFLGIEPGPGIFDPLLVVPDPGAGGDDTATGGFAAVPAVFVV